MWSNLRLFRDGDGFAWIERRSVRESQLTELKKYAVFSKVTIAPDDERVLLGVAGFQARAALANIFSELPSKEKQVVKEGATTLLWFEHPAERFLTVTDEATANMLTDKLRGEAELNNSQQWLALNIEAGFPVIDAANSGPPVSVWGTGGMPPHAEAFLGSRDHRISRPAAPIIAPRPRAPRICLWDGLRA